MTDSKYSNRSFLTEEQKKEIMHLYIDEGMTYTEIGYKYGMSKTPIFNFIRRQNITEAQNEKHWAAYVKTHPGTILTAGRKRANASPRKRPKPCAYFEAPSPHRNIITEKQIQTVIKLRDQYQMSFDEIAKRMGFSAGYLATTYNKRKQKNEEQGFYACNRWCNGCKYYGKLLATPCCWYTYYTGKAKDEPAKGCSYKEYGESLEIAERRRT